MITFSSQSSFEQLPDEILLEICKYLLCTDILQSCLGLNYRITQMITQYRYHVSFHKTSISTFDNLCINILPHIGCQIRTLLIDCCYSVLQDELFIKYFQNKMSVIFPRLERVSLVSYERNQLVTFLNNLYDLNYLVEIRLYNLFSIDRYEQTGVIRSLIQANNHRLTTILIDDQSSSLSFADNDRYLNILRLRINLKTVTDLPFLFCAVPNVQYLDVLVQGTAGFFEYFDGTKLSPLLHLIDFQLKSVKRLWNLEEISILLIQLPIVYHLSLFLSTSDRRLIEGNTVLSLLPSTVQQFDYAIYYLSNIVHHDDDMIVSSWPSSHPIAWLFNDKFLFIHTLPWPFTRMEFSLYVNKIALCRANSEIDYNRQVEQLDLKIDKNFTFRNSLSVISKCPRVRDITVYVKNDENIIKEEQFPIPRLPKLSRLMHICFYGSIPSDLNYFSFILNVAPNLFRLDLPFNYLLRLIEDQQICHVLSQCITSICILRNESETSLVTFNEEHIPIIASVLSRVRDLYVDLAHLPDKAAKISNQNISEDHMVQNLSIQSCQQQSEIVSSSSCESMLICLLTKFKEHRLICLCADGQFSDEIKTNTEEWLKNNTILCEQKFKAGFSSNLNRLLIWM